MLDTADDSIAAECQPKGHGPASGYLSTDGSRPGRPPASERAVLHGHVSSGAHCGHVPDPSIPSGMAQDHGTVPFAMPRHTTSKIWSSTRRSSLR
jgi:hypothetical protein